jgi:hypothetical protein
VPSGFGKNPLSFAEKVKEVLIDEHYEVLSASNGEEAILQNHIDPYAS